MVNKPPRHNDNYSIAHPDTLLRWYKKLVAEKYDGSKNRGPGLASRPERDQGLNRSEQDKPSAGLQFCPIWHSAFTQGIGPQSLLPGLQGLPVIALVKDAKDRCKASKR